MPVLIGTPGASDVLWSNDPRAGLVPNSASDQTTKLQALADLNRNRPLQQGDRVATLLPGEYRKSDQIDITPTDGHRPPALRGYGSMIYRDAPTVIVDTADAGAGKFTLKKTGAAAYDFSGLSFYGLGPTLVPGHPGWAMRGVHANGKGHIYDVCVAGYQCGVAIDGDHHNLHDLILTGNVYGIEFPTGGTSQGDIVFRKVQADGNSKAGIGVAKDRVMAGVTWDQGSGGQGPYMILRYDVPGAPSPSGPWLTGCVFNRIATEFCGNGVVYDAVGDGAGISDIDWIGNGVDWGLFSSDREWVYNGESQPKVAAWYTSGSISDFRVHQGFPGLSGGLPAFKAANITNLTAPYSGAYVLPKLVAGERAFEVTGGSSFLPGCSIGRPGDIWIKPYRLATGNTVARGELITPNNENDAKKYTGTGVILGVATQACDGSVQATRVVCALKAGNTSDTQVKNTSGVSIPPNTYLIPHSGGGVQAEPTNNPNAAGVIGRSTATIGTTGAALGAAHLYNMAA